MSPSVGTSSTRPRIARLAGVILAGAVLAAVNGAPVAAFTVVRGTAL